MSFVKEILTKRLMIELEKIIIYNDNVLISTGQTIILFKIFSLFKILIEKSSKKQIFSILKNNYQEEFKYYFSEEKIKSKCYNYYPIVKDLLQVVNRLENLIGE
jgi:hypothetical protein